MTLIFDLWPWQPFKQCPHTWWIFVPSSIQIPPLTKEYCVTWQRTDCRTADPKTYCLVNVTCIAGGWPVSGRRAVVHVVMMESVDVTSTVSVRHPTCLCIQSIIVCVCQSRDRTQSEDVLLMSTVRAGWQDSGHTWVFSVTSTPMTSWHQCTVSHMMRMKGQPYNISWIVCVFRASDELKIAETYTPNVLKLLKCRWSSRKARWQWWRHMSDMYAKWIF